MIDVWVIPLSDSTAFFFFLKISMNQWFQENFVLYSKWTSIYYVENQNKNVVKALDFFLKNAIFNAQM